MNLNSDSDRCQGGESIDCTMVTGAPSFEYASPLAPQFSIGRESQKDVWVISLDQRKKILVTHIVKEEFKDI